MLRFCVQHFTPKLAVTEIKPQRQLKTLFANRARTLYSWSVSVPFGYDLFVTRICQTDVPALTSHRLRVQEQNKP